jgi:hypothetical protein
VHRLELQVAGFDRRLWKTRIVEAMPTADKARVRLAGSGDCARLGETDLGPLFEAEKGTRNVRPGVRRGDSAAVVEVDVIGRMGGKGLRRYARTASRPGSSFG